MKSLEQAVTFGSQVANYFREYQEAVELRCLNKNLSLPSEVFPIRGEELSAQWMRDWLSNYQDLLHYLHANLLQSSSFSASIFLGILIMLQSIGEEISALKEKTQILLSCDPGSFHLLDTYTENFTSLDKVEPGSTSLVGLQKGGIAPSFGSFYTVTREEVITSVFSNAGTYIAENIPLGGDLTATTEVVALKIRTQSSGSVSVTATVAPPRSDNWKFFKLNCPVNNGIEKIKVEAHLIDKTKETVSEQEEFKGNTIVGLTSGPIRKLVVTLVSTIPDGVDEYGPYHLFLVSQINFGTVSPGEATTFYSKPISFPNTTSFKTARFKATYSNPVGYSPSFSIAARRTSTFEWCDWKNVSPDSGEQIRFSASKLETNTGGSSSPLQVIPYNYNHIAKVNWSVSSAYVPSLLEAVTASSYTWEVDPASAVVLRSIGTAGDSSSTGWLFEEGVWKTNLLIQSPREVDFGPHKVCLNGLLVSGKQLLQKGVHHLRVPPSAWASVAANYSQADMLAADPLAPYNIKYVIQGYPGVSIYPEIGMIGAYECRFVAPEVLYFKETYDPTLFSLAQDSGVLVPIIPIEYNYTNFYSEKVAIWLTLHDISTYCDMVKVKIQFPESPISGTYVKSYSVMVA